MCGLVRIIVGVVYVYIHKQLKQFRIFQVNTLKKLELMSQPMQRCDNCLKEFPQSKIATHFGYCRRNIKKCATCGEMYDINCQEQHEEQFHKKAKCEFCKKQFAPTDMDKHRVSCSRMTKFCEYCQLNVPVNEYNTHLKACESRTKVCQKCKKSITNKDFLIHMISCKGMVQEPTANSYDQYIRNQRKDYDRPDVRQDGRQEVREVRQYGGRVEYKADYKGEQKKQYDFKRRQPQSNPITNPTTYSIPSNSRQSKPAVIPSSSSSNSTSTRPQVGQQSNPTTGYTRAQQQPQSQQSQPIQQVYNPRQINPRQQIKEQPRGVGVGGVSYGNNLGRLDNKPVQYRAPQIRREVIKTDIRTDPRVQPRIQPRIDNKYDNKYQNKYDNKYDNKYADPKKIDQPSYGYNPIKPTDNVRRDVPSYKPTYPSSSSSGAGTGVSYRNQPPKVSPVVPTRVTTNDIKREPARKAPVFDPSQYGGYQQQDYSAPQYNPRSQPQHSHNSHENGNGIDQDQQFQRALMQSLNQNNKADKKQVKKSNNNTAISKELDSEQIMNSSFYDVMDVEKQKAIYQEMQRNAKKGNRR